MNSYVRPVIETPVSRDAAGQVIEYGRRWWPGSPPDETYSVDTHPERFAPLHIVADALIAHLRAAHDVEITDSVEVAADLIHPVPGVVRAARIRPNNPACATLTFVFTPYPGVVVHAGLLHDFHYPVCGCDACDSTWEVEADQREEQVLATVEGHYTERIESGLRPKVQFTLTGPRAGMSGGFRATDLPRERVKAARPVLRDLVEGWSAWPGGPANRSPN